MVSTPIREFSRRAARVLALACNTIAAFIVSLRAATWLLGRPSSEGLDGIAAFLAIGAAYTVLVAQPGARNLIFPILRGVLDGARIGGTSFAIVWLAVAFYASLPAEAQAIVGLPVEAPDEKDIFSGVLAGLAVWSIGLLRRFLPSVEGEAR